MGQQQLLLIIVGVIITGIAIAVGISIFQANASGVNRDAVWNDLNHLGARAQQYYRKPRALGGGDLSFNGFKLTGKESKNDNGIYVATPSATQVVLLGIGNELGYDEANPITLTMVVLPDTMYVESATIN